MPRLCNILAAIALALTPAVTAAAAAPAASPAVLGLPGAVPVTLLPDVPAVLDRAWVERLDLFPDLADVFTVRFVRAPWGAVVAEIATGDETRLRFLASEEWRRLQDRARALASGAPLPPALQLLPYPASEETDRVARLRTWPEVPLSQTALVVPPARRAAAGFPAMRGRWQAVLEAGLRDNVTDFREFFTPMGMFGVGFAYPFLERMAGVLNFAAGFGDIRRDFEDQIGADGRSNTFSFSLGVMARQPLGRRSSLYAQLDGGYYIRSLLWGGPFYDPRTGEYIDNLVLEQQNWGGALRLGWLLQRRHESKPRFFDVGLAVQTTPARRWDFGPLVADDRDTWVSLTVRFWDAI